MHEFGHSLGLTHGGSIMGLPVLDLCAGEGGGALSLQACMDRIVSNVDLYQRICRGRNDSDCKAFISKEVAIRDLCYLDSETMVSCYYKTLADVEGSISLKAQAEIKRKPNYLSIMNYIYHLNGAGGLPVWYEKAGQVKGKIASGLLDYSIFRLNELNENDLNENIGVQETKPQDRGIDGQLYYIPYDKEISDYAVYFHIDNNLFSNKNYVVNEPIDWNNNEEIENNIKANIDKFSPKTHEAHVALKTSSDWDSLIFGGFQIGCEINDISQVCKRTVSSTNNAETEASSYSDGQKSSNDFVLIPFDQDISGLQTIANKKVILSTILVNKGIENDVYKLLATTTNAWDTQIIPDITIKSGHHKIVQVVVNIPEGVVIDHEEEVLITVLSQGDPLLSSGHTFFIDIVESEDLDSDNDSLSDSQELVIGLDPNNPDTDGDGVSDGVEVLNPLDPLDRNNNGIIDALDGTDIYPLDSDDDGIGDDKETALGLDPFNPDTDDDGINDGLEAFVPRADDQAIDFDGDGQIDALEAGNDAYEKAAALPGDFDSDGDVDLDDLTLMRAYFGQPASGPDDPADLNNDGVINVLDYRLVARLCTRYRCATQ